MSLEYPLIRCLDDSTSELIEASMKISSLSQIVEILLNNSLQDKTVQNIIISIDTLHLSITCEDDGSGMTHQDLITWKSYGVSDLHLLASLSHVEFDNVVFEGGRFFRLLANSRNPDIIVAPTNKSSGTKITVRDIFHGFYARRMSIRNEREFQQIRILIQRTMILNYSTTVHLYYVNSPKQDIDIPLHGSLLDRFLYFHDISVDSQDDIMPIVAESKQCLVQGFITTLDTAQVSRNNCQYVYVNGVYQEGLVSLIESVYFQYMNRQQRVYGMKRKHYEVTTENDFHPSFVLAITMKDNREFNHDITAYICKLLATLLKSHDKNTQMEAQLYTPPTMTLHGLTTAKHTSKSQATSKVDFNACFDIIEQPVTSSEDTLLDYPTVDDTRDSSSSSSSFTGLRLTISRHQSTLIDMFDQQLVNSYNVLLDSVFYNDDVNYASNYEYNSNYSENILVPEVAYIQQEQVSPPANTTIPEPTSSGTITATIQTDEDLSSAPFARNIRMQQQQSRAHAVSGAVTKEDLSSCSTVGQADKKFIFTLTGGGSKRWVLCFDQHAVDERVQLEAFPSITPSFLAKNNLYKQICEVLNLSSLQYTVLVHHEELLLLWGFRWRLPDNTVNFNGPHQITVLQVPLVLDEPLTTQDFVEFLNFVDKNQDLPLIAKRPPCIQRILASRACRSAVKFGDELTPQACDKLVHSLKTVDFPFQCAHGRPSVAPLLDLRQLHAQRRAKQQQRAQALVDF